ncbi:MAG: hypothetical protein P8M25_03045 [Paracoccaceae bacterium]|nr:hypothetical protein [Paracoccaceae bacterium]
MSSDQVHMFMPVPPQLAMSDLMRKVKERLSHKKHPEFLQLKNDIGADVAGAGVNFQQSMVP